jgi:glycosyltransferase involved in cell wall biosynthesis
VIDGRKDRLRIIHLAFEDHLRPGSGGGGVRTREINRRLATRHDITVVTARYPGARRRVEDGVAYRPLGWNLGHLGSMATYHLAIPFFLLSRRADLVVEDFAAPVSSVLVPLWTRCPTIAVVQWLAARETSKRYHLPFYWFEERGMRMHRRFVAVSEAIADRLRTANPTADIRVVYSGIDHPASDPGRACRQDTGAPSRGPDLLYLGRLELQPKGLDLLVEVVEQLGDIPDLRVVIAGDGPHGADLADLIEGKGLSDRIELVGRIEGEAKWRLLTSARVLVLPSRYESFGLVVAEAGAAGTPVVGWALPPFEEILEPGGGRLVPPFDVPAFAAAVRDTLSEGADDAVRARLQVAARRLQDRFGWDRAAAEQEDAYRAAAGPGPRPRRPFHLPFALRPSHLVRRPYIWVEPDDGT